MQARRQRPGQPRRGGATPPKLPGPWREGETHSRPRSRPRHEAALRGCREEGPPRCRTRDHGARR